MNFSVAFENGLEKNNFNSSIEPSVTGCSCSLFLKQIKQTSWDIFSRLRSLSVSADKEVDLAKCIHALKTITSLSQKQRLNWSSWYKLHYTALKLFTFRIPGSPLPWHPMQLRIQQFLTNSGLRTSCGITQQIAFTMLLGAKDAARSSIFGKFNQLKNLDSILKGHKTLLLSFQIDPCNLGVEGGPLTHYGGHVWTVFKASPDRYLLITSYLHKQNTNVMELNSEEFSTHIKDIHIISNAEKWTTKVDAVYKRWFGVSHSELIGLNSQEQFKRPWQIFFKPVQPNIRHIDRFKAQFSQSLRLPYFPKGTVLEKGEELPIDDLKVQDANKYWCVDISSTLSLRDAIYDYIGWIRSGVITSQSNE